MKILIILLITTNLYADWHMVIDVEKPVCRFVKELNPQTYAMEFLRIAKTKGDKCKINPKISKTFGGIYIVCMAKDRAGMAVFYPNMYKCNKYKRLYEKFQKKSKEFQEVRKKTRSELPVTAPSQ